MAYFFAALLYIHKVKKSLNGRINYIFFIYSRRSLFSPCFLPLLPAYLSFLTVQNTVNMQEFKPSKKLLTNSSFFALGFTVVFVLVGATAAALGSFLVQNISVIRKIGAIMIILFGLIIINVIKIPLLLRGKNFITLSKKQA